MIWIFSGKKTKKYFTEIKLKNQLPSTILKHKNSKNRLKIVKKSFTKSWEKFLVKNLQCPIGLLTTQINIEINKVTNNICRLVCNWMSSRLVFMIGLIKANLLEGKTVFRVLNIKCLKDYFELSHYRNNNWFMHYTFTTFLL